MIKFVRQRSVLHVDAVNDLPFDWGIIHMLNDEPMALDEVIAAAQKYNEDYAYEGSPFETNAATVAESLIRLCEYGLATTSADTLMK